MSIDFNGTTSKLENTSADLAIGNEITICTSCFAEGLGELNFGGVVKISHSTERRSLHHRNAANQLGFQCSFSGGNFNWRFPGTDGQWNRVAVSFDSSSAANTPVVRVNLAPVTVTTVQAGSGTALDPGLGWCVGNNTGQAVTRL